MKQEGVLWAEVLPSPLAVEADLEKLARESPGGMLLTPPRFHIENLMPTLLAQAPLPAGTNYLDDTAGAILVHRLLHESQEETELYAGLAAGWRLPDRLWRLLVEVRAAGLNASGLDGLANKQGTPGLKALARLMAGYEAELQRLGLKDQADRLEILGDLLAKGQKPALLAGWQGLRVRQVIWLRALDLRLLNLLSQAMPVEVSFAQVPEIGSAGPLYRLISATWQYLETKAQGRVTLSWDDLDQGDGAWPDLIQNFLIPGRELSHPGKGRLELVREAGRYAEVESLLQRAWQLVRQGVEPSEIAIAFPDLSLYGQMALDVAQRLGLPLNVGYSLPLSQFPLVLSLQNLLALAQDGFASQSLAAVWDCPYLGRPLARHLGVNQPKGAQNLLKMAGYLDGRETPPGTFLARAAGRPGLPGPALEDLAKASQELVDWLGGLGLGGGKLSLAAFAQAASQILDSLDLGNHLLWLDENSQAPWAAARDLASLSALGHELEQLGQAADLVGAGPDFSLGRCLQVLRGVLEGRSLRLPGGDPFGVKVLHQAEAAGLKVHTMMLGGLNLGEFPPKPAGQNLLSAAERLALGKASRDGLPVWRTDQEEYSGQVLRWLWLIGSARERVVLSTAAAGSDGKPLESANPLLSLLVRLNEKMPQPAGGVYGDLPELADCLEPGALLGRLAASLLRPGGRDRDLAQAVLYAWSQEPGFARRWQAIASRAGMEARREHLNQVALDQRFPRADEYSGLISHPSARDLLAEIVVRDRFRRWSPSGLEAYIACPLAWFSARLLRVEEIQKPGWGLEPAGEGGWVHLALKKFFDPNEFDPLMPWEDIRARLADCLDLARQELLAAGTPGHPATWQAKQKALLAGLERVVERECDALGSARPLAVESEMGVSLEVSPGWDLTLAGRLDRLDLVGQVLQVTDYKHTVDQFAMRQAAKQENLAQGYFQLPLYLAAALEHQGPGPSLLKGRLVNTRLPGQNIAQVDLEPDCDLLTRDPSRREALAREGIANLFNAVRDVYQRVRSGDFVARPQEPICRNCNLGLICRARPAVEISSAEQ